MLWNISTHLLLPLRVKNLPLDLLQWLVQCMLLSGRRRSSECLLWSEFRYFNLRHQELLRHGIEKLLGLLKIAIIEGLKPLLMITKVDRLILWILWLHLLERWLRNKSLSWSEWLLHLQMTLRNQRLWNLLGHQLKLLVQHLRLLLNYLGCEWVLLSEFGLMHQVRLWMVWITLPL